MSICYQTELYQKSASFKETKKRVNTRWKLKNKKGIKDKRRRNYLKNKAKILKANSEWQKRNKKKVQEYQRTYRERIIKELLFVYGSFCSCCKEPEPMFLTLDHMNGGGNADYKTFGRLSVLKRAIKERDFKKYQILCWNCNLGRQRNGGICPHQKKEQLNGDANQA